MVEGISLHQGDANSGGNDVPRAQLDHDLRWSSVAAHQLDGRSHRNGRHAPVYWLVAKGTVDERVAEVLLLKLQRMGRIQGDDTREFEELLAAVEKMALLPEPADAGA